MVVVFGIDIDIDLDTIYEYGNALARILMAISPILLIGSFYSQPMKVKKLKKES